MTSATDGHETRRLLTRLALEELNSEFAYRVDHDQGMGVEELFAPEGYYGRLGGPRSVGREAIRETYVRRRAHGERTARHVFTNLRLIFETSDRVRGTSIMTLFAEDGMPPLKADILAVSDFIDVYVRQRDGRWLYESRLIRSVFVGNALVVLPLGESTGGQPA